MNGRALTGGCNCGAVRYRIAGKPFAVVACHCSQCRRQSGAAHSVNLVVRTKDMDIEGELACWTDHDTESGAPVSREFCAACGSPIQSLPSSSPGLAAVKAGTLDEPASFAPEMHFWTASKLAWVQLPDGIAQFERGPQA